MDIKEVSDPRHLVADPVVSVLMITYNHARFLAQAIEGAVHQVCDFPYEILIGEDASSDDTLAIALEYQKRYPALIRVIHSDANVGMQANSVRIFERARGTYLTYCEGDDFWCAPDKLARQVALIDGDDSIGIVHSDWTRAHPRDDGWTFDMRASVHRRTPLRLLQGDLFATWHLPRILRTCTVLLRKSTVQSLLDSGLADGDYRFGDSVLNAYVTSRWKVAYVPAVTAIYRVSPNSALRSGVRSRVSFYRSCLDFDSAARAYFAGRAAYGKGYRWESAAGLLLWGIRARDAVAVRDAIADFRRHFTLVQFVVEGWRAVAMRLPTWRRQSRTFPDMHSPSSRGASS